MFGIGVYCQWKSRRNSENPEVIKAYLGGRCRIYVKINDMNVYYGAIHALKGIS